LRVLGISTAHDSSVAIYCDGKIEFFFKEERLTGTKRDKQPFAALFQAANFLNGKKVDAVAVSSPILSDEYLTAIKDLSSKIFRTKNIYDLSATHHLCHASLVFYNSGFNESLVFILDRNGSLHQESHGLALESETVFWAKYPNTFEEIKKNYWSTNIGPNSDSYLREFLNKQTTNKKTVDITCESSYGITKVYETATTLIGQHILENGKTMGLAAYGNKNENFINLFSETGVPNDSLFTHVISHHDGSSAAIFKKYINNITTSVDKDNYQLYADYAYQVQAQTQDQVSKMIHECIEKTQVKNVCISGGYGLNVVANGYYISKFPNVNFFFEPLADDTGNSIGAAMLIYRQITSDNKKYPIKSTFFNGYEPEINPNFLNKDIINKVNYKKTKINKISDLLLDNKSVAIFDGKSEAGPRALGHRSILFYPNLLNSKDIVNKIKKREWYRPFAACVLKEEAKTYFDMMNITDSPYMTISFSCLEKTKSLFPGIVHVDGSCRVQTVDEENVYLYNLLKELKKSSGHGLLLNTSFNLAGSPLVETLDQALWVMLESELDYVWVPKNNILYFDKNIKDQYTYR